MEKPTTVNPGWRKSSYSGNGGASCVEVGAWRKSSYSDNGGASCVEVGGTAVGVLVRDTTNRAGVFLTVPAAAWRALLADIRSLRRAARTRPEPPGVLACRNCFGGSAAETWGMHNLGVVNIRLGAARNSWGVLHTPGHSPDSICLLDERGGLLFAGDTLITGDSWAHTPDTRIAVLAATLRTLADDLAGQLSAIYPAHTLRYQAGPGLLNAAADAFEAILSGSSAGAVGTDLLGRPAIRHEFSEFTILRPVDSGR